MHTSDIDKFVDLLRHGNRHEAKEGLLACVSAGFLDAHYYLASAASEDGDLSNAQLHLSLLEQSAWTTSNARLHSLASIAYRMMLGLPSRECSDYLALAHLVRAAELGAPDAQSSLAHFYRRGTNGAKKDISQFEYWIEKAVAHEQPIEAAVLEYVEHLVAQKKKVPQRSIEYLRSIAADDQAIQRLLAKASAA